MVRFRISDTGELYILEIYTLYVLYISVKSLPFDKDGWWHFFFKEKKIAILLERKNLKVL